MRERLVLVLAGVLLITVLVGGLLTWQSMKLNREVNQAILAKLDAMSTTATRAEVPENWAKAKIRLARGTPDGAPAAGIRVELRGKPFNDTDENRLYGETNDQGVVVFGLIRPGRYEFATRGYPASLDGASMSLYPGQVHEEVFTCPDWIDAKPGVSIRIAPTNGRVKEGTLLTCAFVPDQGFVRFGSNTWSLSETVFEVTMAGEKVTSRFDQDMKEIGIAMPSPLDPPPASLPGRGGLGREGRAILRLSRVAAKEAPLPLVTSPTTTLPLARFRLARLTAWIPNDWQTTGTGTKRQWFHAATVDYATQQVKSDFPGATLSAQPPRGGGRSSPRSSDDESRRALPAFEVKPSGENVWTIELPPAFVEQIALSTKQLDESQAIKEQARLEDEKLKAEREKVTQNQPATAGPLLPSTQTRPQPR